MLIRGARSGSLQEGDCAYMGGRSRPRRHRIIIEIRSVATQLLGSKEVLDLSVRSYNRKDHRENWSRLLSLRRPETLEYCEILVPHFSLNCGTVKIIPRTPICTALNICR